MPYGTKHGTKVPYDRKDGTTHGTKYFYGARKVPSQAPDGTRDGTPLSIEKSEVPYSSNLGTPHGTWFRTRRQTELLTELGSVYPQRRNHERNFYLLRCEKSSVPYQTELMGRNLSVRRCLVQH